MSALWDESGGVSTRGMEGLVRPSGVRFLDPLSLLWYNLSVRMTPAVQEVVGFAKRLPGFCLLPQDDQLILIKVPNRVYLLTVPCYRLATEAKSSTFTCHQLSLHSVMAFA